MRDLRESDGFGAIDMRAVVFEEEDVRRAFPKKPSDCNKGDFGRVAVIAGYGSFGAPILSARAALTTGAGYTELLLPAGTGMEARLVLSTSMPACIVREAEGIPAVQSIAYGMGAGVGEGQYALLTLLLHEFRGTLLLDADALNTLARFGKEVLKEANCKLILTPHPLEFSRLSGLPVEAVLRDLAGCAESFAEEYGAVVVLKNFRSVIADKGFVAVNPTGSPVLARGGSGDVLSGIIAGLAARIPPREAAVYGSYLLGRAGELAEARGGAYAPDAQDVIAALKSVIAELSR